jgi:predicted nuclease with TOPRIM domain
MIKVYIFLFLMMILSGIGFSAYSYFNWSQNTIATLRENNTKLVQATETLQNTVKRMEADSARMETLNRELSGKLREAEAGLDRLRKRFTELDITREALENATSLETRINNAVNRLIRDFEEKTAIPGMEPPQVSVTAPPLPATAE